MRSNNALVIPTLGNFELLKNISAYLNKQTSSDFNIVFIIGKDVNPKAFREEMDKALNSNYYAIPQTERGIIGAINKALELNFKLMVLTDDDAEPSASYVSNAIDFLENRNEVGMVFGKVNGGFPDSAKSKFSRFFNSLSSRKNLFGRYPYRFFNTAGLSTGIDLRLHSDKPIEDYFPIGVCMAWRQNVTNDFKLPYYGNRGIFFESYISSLLWTKGFTTFFSPSLEVCHINRESLSRSKKSSLEILREMYLSPTVLSQLGFELDLESLKKLLLFARFLPHKIKKVITDDLKNFLEESGK